MSIWQSRLTNCAWASWGASLLIALRRVSAERRNARLCPSKRKKVFVGWKGYRLACQLAAECPGTQIVSVADCEADIYDIFVDARQQPGPHAEYIIRAKEDRSTLERDPESGPRAYCKVRAEVSRSKMRTTRTIELCQTPKRRGTSGLIWRFARSPCRCETAAARKHLLSVTHNVVLVEEIEGPGDDTDLS